MPDIPVREKPLHSASNLHEQNKQCCKNTSGIFKSQISLLFQWTDTVKQLCRRLAARRERWNAWPFPLRFNHPSTMASQERSRERGSSLEKKRKMNHTMSSLCLPAYCERHESEQWCLSRGALYAHLHWFGSSIHETGTLFIHTYFTKLVAVPS